MAQSQIIQTGPPDLGGGNGVAGRISLDRIPVKNGKAVFLAALGPEIVQQPRAVHALKARAVDPAVQAGDGHGFQSAGKHKYVLRPALLQPGAAGCAEIMVARGDQHRHAAALQFLFQNIQRLPAGLSVQQVSRQQHQVAFLPAAKIRHLAGDLSLLPL